MTHDPLCNDLPEDSTRHGVAGNVAGNVAAVATFQHDPLCPSYGLCDCGCEYDAHCMCGFITKVRADTLDKAVQRVEQNVLVGMTLTPKEVRAVIAAVRGQS